ncbi:MAG: hypothetical protein HYX38_19840 [Rhodospirillales bacterium]|nr:hypothetical protein [Rhodospirillales bacterium]
MRTNIFRLCTALLLALSLAVPLGALAGDRIYYGTRAGMHVTTVGKSGIGTANAVILIKHTPEDAKAVCVEYLVDESPDCVRRMLAELKIADRVSGNCTTRTWTDMYDGRYAFMGEAKKSDDMIADYAIKDLRTGEILDGSPPSGYDVQLTIFQQLCPGVAK